MLKTSGYLVSTVSVLLLGVVSWQSASTNPLIFACLIAGMLSSVGGMFLRWLSFHRRQKQAKGAVAQLASVAGPSGMVSVNRRPSGRNSTSVVARRS